MLIKLQDFRAALAAVKPAVSSKTTLPALACVRLSQTKECCHFLTTDADQWLSTYCPATNTADWSACLNFTKLESAAKFWVADTVGLDLQGEFISVRCGAYSHRFPFLPAVEMKDPPAVEAQPVLVPDFAAKLRRLLPFCSTDETRWTLMGVHLEDGYMEATDGMCYLRVPADIIGKGVIFPASAIRSLEDGDAVLQVGVDTVTVTVGDTTLTTKLIEGNLPYPNTKPFQPDMAKRQTVTCFRKELLSAVECCQTQAASAAYANVWLTMDQKTLTVRLSRKDGPETQKVLPCKAQMELSVALSAARLIDLLRAFEDEEITLSFDGLKEPLAIIERGVTGVCLLSRITE